MCARIPALMIGELQLSVLSQTNEDLGFVSGFVVTDEMIVALGGTSAKPAVFASRDARTWQARRPPWDRGLRDGLAVGNSVWACGEWGQLAVTHDHGASWMRIATGTEGCLFGVALAIDGSVWVVGDTGYAARVLGEQPRVFDLQTRVRFTAVYPVRDEVVVLGYDGNLRRWRDGAVTVVGTGTTKPISALAITAKGTWIVVGDGGFVARSPDGQWFTKVASTADVDLEAIAELSDGSLVVVGDRGFILRSTDDGRTWRRLSHDAEGVHLWAIERFGAGVLIGGDFGYIGRLAPPSDTTWADRYVPAGPSRIEQILLPGPENFIATRLEAYLDELGLREARSETAGQPPRGDASTFQHIYGMPLPDEAAHFFAATANARPWDSFEELRLDQHIRSDVGDQNLFELMVLRAQSDPRATDLSEAMCGVFAIGSQGDGDTYHLELYAWDGPRQVMHFDHETSQFTGAIADSLDSLVYLAAVVKVGDEMHVSDASYSRLLESLYGKVAPTWHFAIEQKARDFVRYEAKRHDSEFFSYRSRWICALLQNTIPMAEIAELFNADLNQAVPSDQLHARFEACEKFIPMALYSLWRAFLFGEPELDRYLQIGREHSARLVRDAAKLVRELLDGRTQLGTITDVPAHLAAFRALDLDPRGAGAREARARARAAELEARRQAALAELATAPKTAWKDLAWQWLGDGIAHAALLDRLAEADAPQVSALDELDLLRDDERQIAVPMLAATLSPELEAVLVGTLARGAKAGSARAEHRSRSDRTSNDAELDRDDDDIDDIDDDDDRPEAPGWNAIDEALRPIYGDAEPLHYATTVPYNLGGSDPIHGISVYARTTPMPHWHFVTYGFTDLFQKETDDPAESGFGFELTFRLGRKLDDKEPPKWVLGFLQNLGRYVFGTGNRFAAGHKMGLNGPIALDTPTKITAICFADDPELGEFVSAFGSARFLQIVGITDDEYKLIQEWSTTGLVELLEQHVPLLVTQLGRTSVLDDPATAALVEHKVSKEGSSEDLTFAGELVLEVDDGRVRMELGALYAAALPRAMRGRIRHGRSYELRGREVTLHLEPAPQVGYRYESGELVLAITHELAIEIEGQLRANLAGTYRFESWPALEIVVTPSFIRSQEGEAIEVRGIADPEKVQRLLAEENGRIRGGTDAHDDDDDGDDAADGDDDDSLDDAPPDPAKVTAALALSERALRLAPHDGDVQFTHAMLLLDGDRAGLTGKGSELVALLPQFSPAVRINVAVRMSELEHPRFEDVIDVTLDQALPERIMTDRTLSLGGGAIASFGDVAHELFAELGEAILERAPAKMANLVPLLPDDVTLMSELAWKSIQARQRDTALALYDRLLALPIPDEGEERTNYLRAINNACVQAHAAKAYDAAVRIADRAQPVAHENPYIFHSAACAYAAIGEYDKALEQVRKAIQHGYDHLAKIEVDDDLGALLDSPEFKALFRDWHARQEGN